MSEEFSKQENRLFVGEKVEGFDPAATPTCRRGSGPSTGAARRTRGPLAPPARRGGARGDDGQGGAAIPHAGLAPCTDRIDWREIELRVYGTGSSAEGLLCLPEDGELHRLRLKRGESGFALREDPLDGRVAWRVRAIT